jgi:membrane-associated protease RseP (regulator of RpoE activity)
MKTLTFAALSFLVATSAFAQTTAAPGRARTIIMRDGEVVTGKEFFLSPEVLGGKRAHLGVSLIDLTAELRDHYGASKDAGVLVGAVEDGSPADKAGLRVGDIVMTVDGKDVDSAADLRRSLRDKKEGDSVRIEVLRGRNRQTLVASVVEREGVRILTPDELRDLPGLADRPEWRARFESMGTNCTDLQTRIKELEGRLKDLEKKLQK